MGADRQTIPVLLLHEQHAFYWRADGPSCELFVADLDALVNLRSVDVTAAGLPTEATMRALWAEAEAIRAYEAEYQPSRLRGYHAYMLFVDGLTGRILERWTTAQPWVLLAARLRQVA